MASQFEPFFERSRFGQQKKRGNSAQALEAATPAIKDSWREDFRFSDDLAELERQQHLTHHNNELQQHFYQAPAHSHENAQPAYQNYSQPAYYEPPVSTIATQQAQQHDELVEVYQLQAQRVLALEEYIARLHAENEELVRDNQVMARQLQVIFDERAGECVEQEEKAQKQAAKKARYQKIWGKLHLLL